MALKAVLDDLEGVSEEIQKLYKKGTDGKYYLDLEETESHPDVLGLVSNRDEILTERKKLQEKLDALKDVDPEEYRALKVAAEEAERKKLESEGDLKAIKEAHEKTLKQVREEAEKEKAAAKEETEKERKAARTYFMQREIDRAIAAADGSAELLAPVVEGFVEVEIAESGDFSLFVTDGKGNKRIKNSKGDPFTLEDLMAELRENERYARAFEPSDTTGSGSTGSGKGGEKTSTGKKKYTRAQLQSGEADVDAISKGEAVVVD